MERHTKTCLSIAARTGPSVRLLPVVGLPCAFGEFHISKDSRETGILRAAGIKSKTDPAGAFPHMADAHLGKVFTVPGAFDTIVIPAPVEPVPHDLDICRYGGGSPVGIAMVCYDPWSNGGHSVISRR